ncbi:hypothetical protein ACM66B_000982 [Microbotryomycetes sp. NB124-2]
MTTLPPSAHPAHSPMPRSPSTGSSSSSSGWPPPVPLPPPPASFGSVGAAAAVAAAAGSTSSGHDNSPASSASPWQRSRVVSPSRLGHPPSSAPWLNPTSSPRPPSQASAGSGSSRSMHQYDSFNSSATATNNIISNGRHDYQAGETARWQRPHLSPTPTSQAPPNMSTASSLNAASGQMSSGTSLDTARPGPRPQSSTDHQNTASDMTSPNPVYYGEQTPRPSGSQALHGSDINSKRVVPTGARRVEYDEDGSERMARAMMEGLGLSTEGSPANSPQFQQGDVDLHGGPRRNFEEQNRWSQQSSNPHHANLNQAAFAQGGTGSSIGDHHDSSSSQAGLMSPLSPHVEPFSPATSAASGASAWGPSGSSAGSRADREREPSNLDLRSSLPPSSSHLGPLPTSSMAQHDLAFASSSPFGQLRGASSPYADGGFSQPQPTYPMPAVPLSHHYGSDSGSDYQAHSATQPIPALSGFAMTHSSSRDGYMHASPPNVSHPATAAALVAHGLSTAARREREIPTDRGGYVRPGYAEASARGTLGYAAGIGPLSSTNTSTPVDPSEEISTIFVVGFPEDMMEREFQNMFLFANGFQAATLKIPASTVVARERERDLATAAAVNAAVGGGLGVLTGYADTFGGGSEGMGPGSVAGSHDDAYLPLGEQAYSTPLGPIVSRESAGSPAGQRKQIIGFAKFHTRAQALEARDILNGRKVDIEKGCALKAEMAKKNLHTKRGPSGDLGSSFPVAGLDPATIARLTSAGTINPALLAELARQTAAASGQTQSHSDPSSGPSTTGQQTPQQWHDGSGIRDMTRLHEQSNNGTGHPQHQQAPQHMPPPPPPPQPPRLDEAQQDQSRSRRGFPHEGRIAEASPDRGSDRGLPGSGMSTSPPSRGSSHLAQHRQQGASSMMQQLDASSDQRKHQEQMYSSPFLPQQGHAFGDTTAQHRPHNGFEVNQPTTSLPLPPSSANRFSSPALHNFPSSPMNGGAPSPMLGPDPSNGNAMQIPRTQNPADMNAPKNTLYVGGLPAVLPSLTGPFSAAHLEENLRNIFSRCPGFRRLSFRAKSNGPIVFVEFEDTHYATRALQEMYGNTLGGLVKGGIRLSYSKNPLGVRSATGGQNGLSSPASQPGFGPPSPMPGRRPGELPYSSQLDFRSTRSPAIPPSSHADFSSSPMPHAPSMMTSPPQDNGPTAFSGTFSPFGRD